MKRSSPRSTGEKGIVARLDRTLSKVEWPGLAHRGSSPDLKPVLILLISTVMLALLHFFGMIDKTPVAFYRWASRLAWQEIVPLAYWVLVAWAVYFLVPAMVVRLGFRESLSSYGVTFRGLGRHLWIYVVLYLCVLPFVVAVSYTTPFLYIYPFYPEAGRSMADFVVWEALYALQFFALEFFFRGFMIHGLKKRLGFYAVVIMVVPYCMIHFYKPFLEAMGAIVAGLVLGTLSYVTGSIIPGFLIHFAVALSMDILALIHKGYWFATPL